MATKSLIDIEDRAECDEILKAPSLVPDGDLNSSQIFFAKEFSLWLGSRIRRRLEGFPEWEKAGPIALGSWARGELCPCSDLDVLFCGDPIAAAGITQLLQKQGVKIRARIPEDLENWCHGVEAFDCLSLLQARAFYRTDAEKLKAQQSFLYAEKHKLQKNWIRVMQEERAQRERRYDSISSFLEPNLKYGHGGLRDLEQALFVSQWTKDRLPTDLGIQNHAKDVLNYYKDFFLSIRQRLHLNVGPGEILLGSEQEGLSQWFGFSDSLAFMRQVERGLARVSFYADWIFAQTKATNTASHSFSSKRLRNPTDLFRALHEDPSISTQAQVRASLEQVFGPPPPQQKPSSAATRKKIGMALRKILLPSGSEAELLSLFRSRLIDRVVPDFAQIVGLVSHDQYHRFSADAHILQALRETKRIYAQPEKAGGLKELFLSLKKSDWETLAWTALYHDLAKGRKEDHSVVGAEILKKDLKAFAVKQKIREQVEWLVRNHLLVSEAAFRRNPKAPATWTWLKEKGAFGERLKLLCCFTMLDIRATNPEAWTLWKDKLLCELWQTIESPETRKYLALDQLKKGSPRPEAFDLFDKELFVFLPQKSILKDLRLLQREGNKKDLAPLVVKTSPGEVWVRLHQRQDRSGLFLQLVDGFRKQSLSVSQASIQTHPEWGVYDWFGLKTQKSELQLSQLFAKQWQTDFEKPPEIEGPKGDFSSIELVAEVAGEWIFSFRGQDRKGALYDAAAALYSAGLEVKWARVHTWGRQIEDVFGVKPGKLDASQHLAKIEAHFASDL